MVHCFGGGWSDIKHNHYDWRPYFKQLYDDPTKLAQGYIEKIPRDIACYEVHGPPPCSVIYANYHLLIGNGAFIYKKNTVITQKIMVRVAVILDAKLYAVKANPATIIRDYYGRVD